MADEAQTVAGAEKAASPVVNDLERKAELNIVSDGSSSPREDDGDRSWKENTLVIAAVFMYNSFHTAVNPPGGFSRHGATAGKPFLAVSNPAAFGAFLNAAVVAAASSAAAVLVVLLSGGLRLVGIGPRVCRWIAIIFIWISAASWLRALSFYL